MQRVCESHDLCIVVYDTASGQCPVCQQLDGLEVEIECADAVSAQKDKEISGLEREKQDQAYQIAYLEGAHAATNKAIEDLREEQRLGR